MQIESQFLISGATLLVTLGINWGITQHRLNAHETQRKEDREEDSREHKNIWKVISEVRGKVETHEKEASVIRLEYEKRFGRHDTDIEVIQKQYAEIIKRLDSLDKKMDRRERDQAD